MNYLEKKFIFYTECQLATLESLPKRTSKSERKRHQGIADGMMEVVSGIDLNGYRVDFAPRVSTLLRTRSQAQRSGDANGN